MTNRPSTTAEIYLAALSRALRLPARESLSVSVDNYCGVTVYCVGGTSDGDVQAARVVAAIRQESDTWTRSVSPARTDVPSDCASVRWTAELDGVEWVIHANLDAAAHARALDHDARLVDTAAAGAA